MNDILLGPDEIKAERKRAYEAWLPESGSVPWDWFWETWKLRAQVKRVVEWIEKRECDTANSFAAVSPKTLLTVRQVIQRKSDALYALNLCAALRAAGGK